MAARHCASPVRVPWSSTRRHSARACFSNRYVVSDIVSTITMSAGSSKLFSRFPALSTISRERYRLVQSLLARLAAAAAFGLHFATAREDRYHAVHKIAQPVDARADVRAASADGCRGVIAEALARLGMLAHVQLKVSAVGLVHTVRFIVTVTLYVVIRRRRQLPLYPA